MSVIIKKPWTRQPQIPTLLGIRAKNIIYPASRKHFTLVGTEILTANPTGIGLRTSPTIYYTEPNNPNARGDWSIVYQLFPREALTTNKTLCGICNTPGSGVYDRQIRHGTAGIIRTYIFDVAEKYADTTNTIRINAINTVIATCSGGSLKIAMNGVMGGTTAVSNNGYNGFAAGSVFCIGNSSNAPVTSDYDVLLAAFIPFALKDYVNLSNNPWQLFQPLSRILYAPAVAAGGFQAAWATRKSKIIGVGVN